MKKLMVFGISLFFILFANLVSAASINLDYPQNVNYGEVFDVELELVDFPEQVYDIKIDIKDSSGARISQILSNNSWKSTYNYVDKAMNSSEENISSFSLNITGEYNGSADIEVKVRDSLDKIESFSGYKINIYKESVEEDNNEDNNQEEENNQEKNESDVSLELEWDKENIVNGDEFEIEIISDSLDEKDYDIRVYIYNKKGEIISEAYDKKQDKWKSGNYYLIEFLSGPGKDSATIKLRINEDNKAFEGEAGIKARIRESGKSPVVKEVGYKIEVLEGEKVEEDNKTSGTNKISARTVTQEKETNESKNIIRLGSSKETPKEKEGKIIYQSGTDKMRGYSIYFLNIILIGILIYLLITFKKGKK